MSTLVTTNLKHGGASSPNIVLNSDGTFNIGDSKVVTPTGSAPSYTCRAWVNFNGTGTVAIRASGNVTSITDNGTGRYTINFTTAFTDTNYALAGFARSTDNSPSGQVSCYVGDSKTTSAMAIATGLNATATDLSEVGVAIFR